MWIIGSTINFMQKDQRQRRFSGEMNNSIPSKVQLLFTMFFAVHGTAWSESISNLLTIPDLESWLASKQCLRHARIIQFVVFILGILFLLCRMTWSYRSFNGIGLKHLDHICPLPSVFFPTNPVCPWSLIFSKAYKYG